MDSWFDGTVRYGTVQTTVRYGTDSTVSGARLMCSGSSAVVVEGRGKGHGLTVEGC